MLLFQKLWEWEGKGKEKEKRRKKRKRKRKKEVVQLESLTNQEERKQEYPYEVRSPTTPFRYYIV